jgi:hypothetical protein
VAGAKYHVSQILSKLNLTTREQAAAWQPPPPERTWRERAVGPLAGALRLTIAKGVGLGVATAILAGVLLLGWAEFGKDESTGERGTSDAVQLPKSGGLLTMDQVLVHAGRGAQTPVEEAQVTLTTYAGAIDQIEDRGYDLAGLPGEVLGDSPTWLVFLSTHERRGRNSAESPIPVTATPDECQQIIVVLPDALSIPKPRFIIQGRSHSCPVGAIRPRDRVVLAAASLGYVSDVLRDTTVSEIRAEEMDTAAAVATIRAAGGVTFVPVFQFQVSGPYRSIDDLEQHARGPNWLVTLSGLLYDSMTPVAGGQTPACRQLSAIVTTAGQVLLSALNPLSTCS